MAPTDFTHATGAVDELDAAVETWEASCPSAGADGLCVALRPSAGEGCGAPHLGVPRVVERDVETAVVAEAELQRALERAAAGNEPTSSTALAAHRNALGRARLALLDVDLEAYLAMPLPHPLDAAPYLSAKLLGATDLTRDLATLKDTGDPESILRAALRTAWVYSDFADSMLRFELPTDLTAEQIDQYCARLDEQAARPLEHARNALHYCAQKAAELGYDGPARQACDDFATLLQ
jgi:hypothetical protein